MKTRYTHFILLLLGISIPFVSCNRSASTKGLTFRLVPVTMEDYPFIPVLEGKLRFGDIAPETVIGVPENLESVQFAVIDVSTAEDSVMSVLVGNRPDGGKVYIADLNNNEDFSDDDPLRFAIQGSRAAASVPFQYDAMSGDKIRAVQSRMVFSQTSPNLIEYHYEELWRSRLVAGEEELDVVIERFGPDIPFLFIDINKNGLYEKTFLPTFESLALGGSFFEVVPDFLNRVVNLNHTDQTPVDKGFPAPISDVKILNSDSVVTVGAANEKVTLLVFWSPGCSGSRRDAEQYNQLKRDLDRESSSIRFLAVVIGDDLIVNYLMAHEFDFTHLVSKEIWSAYGVNAPFGCFLIDRSGNIAQRYFGYNDQIKTELLDLVRK